MFFYFQVLDQIPHVKYLQRQKQIHNNKQIQQIHANKYSLQAEQSKIIIVPHFVFLILDSIRVKQTGSILNVKFSLRNSKIEHVKLKYDFFYICFKIKFYIFSLYIIYSLSSLYDFKVIIILIG